MPTRVLSSLPVNSGGTATANSWAWINANTDNDRNYFDLRHASMQLWQRWMQTVPDLVATSVGGFAWDMDSETLRTFAACHKNWGYPVELLSADAIAAKLPCLRDVPPLAAMYQWRWLLSRMMPSRRSLRCRNTAGSGMFTV